MNSQLKLEMAAKNKSFSWGFPDPKKLQTVTVIPSGKRNSLLSVSTGSTGITNFKEKTKK